MWAVVMHDYRNSADPDHISVYQTSLFFYLIKDNVVDLFLSSKNLKYLVTVLQ